jgi:hypothetical protein
LNVSDLEVAGINAVISVLYKDKPTKINAVVEAINDLANALDPLIKLTTVITTEQAGKTALVLTDEAIQLFCTCENGHTDCQGKTFSKLLTLLIASYGTKS